MKKFRNLRAYQLFLFLSLFFGLQYSAFNQPKSNALINEGKSVENQMKTLALGAGCFWCVEAIFEQIKGVDNVVSGYMGGKVKNPTYKEVCSGLTGHAEVVKFNYDPEVVSFAEILEIFLGTHDPTTLNRQGADVGTQYRSAIFYYSEDQALEAKTVIEELNKKGAFPNPIVTEVTPASTFYPAEDYHQEYYELNGEQPYCKMVIKPKMDKLQRIFQDKLK